MELEDCTKEELIFYIKQNGLLSERDPTFDVLLFRADKVRENEHQLYLIADEHLSNYDALTQPYDGKPLRDMPDAIVKKAAAEYELWEEYRHKTETARKRWDRIQEQINALLI